MDKYYCCKRSILPLTQLSAVAYAVVILHAEGYYAQFVLPIILRSDNCFADELVRFAFSTVHKILANDNMDYCRWEKLSELLPDVVWYNSWDKCKRLRKAARRKQYDVDFYA